VSLLAGKSVLITGGASGIGLATALLAAREGARVAICDSDASGGQKAVESVVASGGDAVFVPMDVTDEAQVTAGIEACVRRFGRLDGAFNNAGVFSQPRIRRAAQGRGPYRGGVAARSCRQPVRSVALHAQRNSPDAGQKSGASIVNNASVAGLGRSEGACGVRREQARRRGPDAQRRRGLCEQRHSYQTQCAPGSSRRH
jgi:NAD(P)-dependent dehydrogenase (short-subunit alcohol dehydrogenase family)